MGTHEEDIHQSQRAHKTKFQLRGHLFNWYSQGNNYITETTLIKMVIRRADAARKGNSVTSKGNSL